MTIYIGDMETNGLDPDRIWCILLKEYRNENYLGFVPKEYLDDAKNVLPNVSFKLLDEFKAFVEESHRLVFHNGCGFDFRVFRKLLKVNVVEYRDTLVMSKLAQPKREGGHSIEAWSERLGTLDKKVQMESEEWSSFSSKILVRCYNDLKIGEAVYAHLQRELKDFSVQSVLLEQEAAWLVADQIHNGVKLDIPKVHQLYCECKSGADAIQKEIKKYFPPKPIQHEEPDIYTVTKKGGVPLRLVKKYGEDFVGDASYLEFKEFNLDSPLQRVEKLLELGWTPLEYTKKTEKGGGGSPKFTEESLVNIPEDAPQALRKLADYLMLRSRERTFKQWLDGVDRDDFIHGYVDTLGTRTQRMSHNNPNLGNIARTEFGKDKQILYGLEGRYGYESRDCFISSAPDTILVGCDAAGIQLRALAHYCEDEEYIKIISDPAYDPHTTHAEALELSRMTAKTWIYSFLMGAKERKLGSIALGKGNETLWKKRGEEDLEKFFERFPFIKKFRSTLAMWARRGYMFSLSGSKVEIPSEHLAMATALQSFEANIIKKALCLYSSELKSLGIPFTQRLIVHDEFLVETAVDKGEKVGNVIGTNIIEAGRILKSNCPMNYDMKIGKTWAKVH